MLKGLVENSALIGNHAVIVNPNNESAEKILDQAWICTYKINKAYVSTSKNYN